MWTIPDSVDRLKEMYAVIGTMYISQAESRVVEFFTRSGSILPVMYI